MNIESLKAWLPVIGGLLTLAGGLFAFVNGRLGEAKTEEAKARVIRLALEWISISISIAALLLALFVHFLAAVPLYLVVLTLESFKFLRRTSPLERMEVLSVGFLCALFVSLLVTGAFTYVIDRIVSLEAESVRTVGKQVHAMEEQQRSIDHQLQVTDKLIGIDEKIVERLNEIEKSIARSKR
jgi:hypothetical protein